MKHFHSETFDNSLVLLTEHNEKVLISALMMRKCSMGHLWFIYQMNVSSHLWDKNAFIFKMEDTYLYNHE